MVSGLYGQVCVGPKRTRMECPTTHMRRFGETLTATLWTAIASMRVQLEIW